ncbi:peptidyl-prolyl cis-trans isomerase A-like protein [Cricetulus griseus]|nr:peptidyl-prolyl cis-trans isomerase A-like protein [Cricetulus griseus]
MVYKDALSENRLWGCPLRWDLGTDVNGFVTRDPFENLFKPVDSLMHMLHICLMYVWDKLYKSCPVVGGTTCEEQQPLSSGQCFPKVSSFKSVYREKFEVENFILKRSGPDMLFMENAG